MNTRRRQEDPDDDVGVRRSARPVEGMSEKVSDQLILAPGVYTEEENQGGVAAAAATAAVEAEAEAPTPPETTSGTLYQKQRFRNPPYPMVDEDDTTNLETPGAFNVGDCCGNSVVDDGTIQYSMCASPDDDDVEETKQQQEGDDEENLVVAELAPTVVEGIVVPMDDQHRPPSPPPPGQGPQSEPSKSQPPEPSVEATNTKFIIWLLAAIFLGIVVMIIVIIAVFVPRNPEELSTTVQLHNIRTTSPTSTPFDIASTTTPAPTPSATENTPQPITQQPATPSPVTDDSPSNPAPGPGTICFRNC